MTDASFILRRGGDGEHVARAIGGIEGARDADMTAAALAEARYRDWDRARMTGAAETRAHAAGAYTPVLALTAEDTPAVQQRLTLPARIRLRTPLDEAVAIMRGLVDEFGDLFPDECGAAVAWLAKHGAE